MNRTIAYSGADSAVAMAPDASAVPLAVFRCGPRTFSIDDVFCAADCLGELSGFREAWAARERAAAAAAEAGQRADPDAVEQAVEAFRYERDLVSAEECERWLAARGLAPADLIESFTRRWLAERSEVVASSSGGGPPEAWLRRDALLDVAFDRWACALAARVATAAEQRLGWDACTVRAAWCELEAAHRTVTARWLTSECRQRALAGEWLRFTRVEFTYAEFDSEGAAREAVLCAREDRLPLARVAEENGFPCRRAQEFLSGLAPSWAELLTGAQPGDLLLPPARQGDHVVLEFQARVEPTLTDSVVRGRIDEVLREQGLRECESRHIRWMMPVEDRP